ncbi:MAG: sel1 repeat family protein, partial [Proteobacteria bacterium]|nr:sel1 repeat family protein [Pseudomonadota bacterium]
MVGILLSLFALGGAGRVDAGDDLAAAESERFVEAMTFFVKGRVEEGVRLTIQLAEAGEAPAQFIAGRLYQKGYGVAKDACEALKWFEQAATQDHAGAIKQLGVSYHFGICQPQNYDEAIRYYRRAVALGEKTASNTLSELYDNRDWDGYNPRLSFETAKRAWDSNDDKTTDAIMDIAVSLGIHYLNGDGVDVDLNMAERYLLLAANHGLTLAQVLLSRVEGKRGGFNDLSGPAGEAFMWLLMANEQVYTLKNSMTDQFVEEIGAAKYAEFLGKAREKLRQIATATESAIGRAVAWCDKAMAESYECLRYSYKDHDACKSPNVNKISGIRYVDS